MGGTDGGVFQFLGFFFLWGDGKGEGGVCHAFFSFFSLFPLVKSIVESTPRAMNLLHKARVVRKKKKKRGK